MPPTEQSSPSGRENQKERTRQSLLAAARELVDLKLPLSVAKIASQAKISEPTAYRYYSSLSALLRDAVAPKWPGLERLVSKIRAVADPRIRAELAASALAAQVLKNEAAIRTLISLSYADPDGRKADRVARPHFRTVLIDAILGDQTGHLKPAQEKRLRLALAAVISGDAILGLKDSARCSDRELIATMGWSARELVAAALRAGSA